MSDDEVVETESDRITRLRFVATLDQQMAWLEDRKRIRRLARSRAFARIGLASLKVAVEGADVILKLAIGFTAFAIEVLIRSIDVILGSRLWR